MRMLSVMVTDFLNYLQKRDLVNLVNLFAENVEWEVPGNTEEIEWLGVRKNKLEVEMFYKLLWKETAPVFAEVHKMLLDDTDAMLKGVFTTKMLRTGKMVTSIFFIHFIVSGGKIIKYTLLEDSYAVSQSMLK